MTNGTSKTIELINDDTLTQWAVVSSNMEDEEGPPWLIAIFATEAACHNCIEKVGGYFPYAVIDMREPEDEFQCVILEDTGYYALQNIMQARGKDGFHVVANKVGDTDRTGFLFAKTTDEFMHYENAVYALASNFSACYEGGLWDFYELSNGGFYMEPNVPYALEVTSTLNNWTGGMTPDAYGIGITFLALAVTLERTGNPDFALRMRQLKEYACFHPAASDILSFID